MSTQPIHVVPTPAVSLPMGTSRTRELLWKKYSGICHWCQKPTRMVGDNSWDKATIDHIVPRYKGGKDHESNVVLACNMCNNRRNHEDHMGLLEGSLLGNYKESTQGYVVSKPKEKPAPPVVQKPNPTEMYRADRDRLLQELIRARDKIKLLESAQDKRGSYIKYLQEEVERLREENEKITMRFLLKKKLGMILLTLSKKLL